MTGSQPEPDKQRIDYSSPGVIAGGTIALLILMCAVPVFWFILPPVILFLVILYFAYAGSKKKARARALRNLGPFGKTKLHVELAPGMTQALVLNDWGVVFVRFLRPTVELSWGEIRLVDEPRIAVLAFHTGASLAFEVDLSQDRYFLATRAIDEKIRDKTNFDVDPASGKSHLLDKLERAPFEWHGKGGYLIVSDKGVEHERGFMAWSEIDSVREFEHEGDETETDWELRFTSSRLTFEVRSTWFADGREIGNSGYDAIKAIVAERLPGKVAYVRPAPLPNERAIQEFKRIREALKVGFSFALKSGKFSYFEAQFAHLLALVDTFSLDGHVDTQSFYRDYADLLSSTNRPEEAAELQFRAKFGSPAKDR